MLGPRVARYVELDFAQVTRTKIERIVHSDLLSAPLKTPHGGFAVSPDGSNLDAPGVGYHLMACDVRILVGGGSPGRTTGQPAPSASDAAAASPSSETLQAALLSKVDPTLPTIVIMECFLLYLDTAVAKALLQYLLSDVLRPSTHVGVVSYDVVLSGQTDAQRSGSRPAISEFGQVMLHNLSARRLEIPGAKAATWPRDHTARLQQALTISSGAEGQADPRAPESPSAPDSPDSSLLQVRTHTTALSTVWGDIPADTKARLSQVEGLDELEELELLLKHYTISVGERTRSHSH